MARVALVKKSRPDKVYERLHRLITGRRLMPGERIASMKSLASRFETSVPTVQRALNRLEAEGFVSKRHGSGTFVSVRYRPLTLNDSVALCMAGGHLWGDLAQLLSQRLHGIHRIATIVDGSHQHGAELTERLLHADAGCFIVHGNRYFSFETIEPVIRRGYTVIGVVDWEAPVALPRVPQVLTDYADGMRQIVDHLAALGHRRLLVAGTEFTIELITQPDRSAVQQSTFLSAWAAIGGSFVTIKTTRGAEMLVDESEVAEIFASPDAPTAVLAFRDVDAIILQRTLRKLLPTERAARIAITGYYNTPWSSAGDPAITTVDLDLPQITEKTIAMLQGRMSGDARRAPAEPVYVKPKLIVRESSIEKL